ncbi:MAG: hypothetical protein AB8B53_06995 [Flavobacteriales bacterium]
MIDSIPYWLSGLFIATALATLMLYFRAHAVSKLAAALICFWTIFQSFLAFTLFYRVTDTLPPRYALVLIPAAIFIIIGLTNKPLERLLTSKNLKKSTLIHTVRIPVELCLYYLFVHDQVPEILTFSGRNFDILAGITAPLVIRLYHLKVLGLRGMLYWNIASLALVLFILVNGILSSELPFQVFALDQPNVAMTYFPFVLLPALIVPLVVYTHITDIIFIRRKLKGVRTV